MAWRLRHSCRPQTSKGKEGAIAGARHARPHLPRCHPDAAKCIVQTTAARCCAGLRQNCFTVCVWLACCLRACHMSLNCPKLVMPMLAACGVVCACTHMACWPSSCFLGSNTWTQSPKQHWHCHFLKQALHAVPESRLATVRGQQHYNGGQLTANGRELTLRAQSQTKCGHL